MGIKIFIAVKLRPKLFLPPLLLLLLFIYYWHGSASRLAPVQAVLPLSGMAIAIDPGHGGYDPGAIGHNLVEKDLVLAIALYLRDYLQQGGARVIMTRERDMDFLDVSAGPKKRLDMSNRLQVVLEGKADLILSIHANHFFSPHWHGAQVFYQEGSPEGQALARCIQAELIRVLQNTDRQAKSGDFYMLRESGIAGAVVEVGFLSNPAEAELLKSSAYQKKLAWAIYLGAVDYRINACTKRALDRGASPALLKKDFVIICRKF